MPASLARQFVVEGDECVSTAQVEGGQVLAVAERVAELPGTWLHIGPEEFKELVRHRISFRHSLRRDLCYRELCKARLDKRSVFCRLHPLAVASPHLYVDDRGDGNPDAPSQGMAKYSKEVGLRRLFPRQQIDDARGVEGDEHGAMVTTTLSDFRTGTPTWKPQPDQLRSFSRQAPWKAPARGWRAGLERGQLQLKRFGPLSGLEGGGQAVAKSRAASGGPCQGLSAPEAIYSVRVGARRGLPLVARAMVLPVLLTASRSTVSAMWA